jgi:hypothetical protein
LHADGAVILIPQKVQAVARACRLPGSSSWIGFFYEHGLDAAQDFLQLACLCIQKNKVVHQCHPSNRSLVICIQDKTKTPRAHPSAEEFQVIL